MAHKFDPTVYTNRSTLITAAKNALADLQTIENAASFTNAQRDAALNKLAQILRHTVRVVLTGV